MCLCDDCVYLGVSSPLFTFHRVYVEFTNIRILDLGKERLQQGIGLLSNEWLHLIIPALFPDVDH